MLHRPFFAPEYFNGTTGRMKRVVAIDGFHLKGDYASTGILMESMKDHNDQVVVIALGLAPLEDKDQWTWFLRQLRSSSILVDVDSICFVSDRLKGTRDPIRTIAYNVVGLLTAVLCVLPFSFHRFCMRHIVANMKTCRLIGGDDEAVMYDLSRSGSAENFEAHLLKFQRKPSTMQYFGLPQVLMPFYVT